MREVMQNRNKGGNSVINRAVFERTMQFYNDLLTLLFPCVTGHKCHNNLGIEKTKSFSMLIRSLSGLIFMTHLDSILKIFFKKKTLEIFILDNIKSEENNIEI